MPGRIRLLTYLMLLGLVYGGVLMTGAPESRPLPATAVTEAPAADGAHSGHHRVGPAVLDGDGPGLRLRVPLSGEVGVEGAWVAFPERLVFHLEPAVLDAGPVDVMVDDPLIERLRVAQAGRDVVRITLNVDSSVPLQPVRRVLAQDELAMAGLGWTVAEPAGLMLDLSRIVMETTRVGSPGLRAQLARGRSTAGDITVVVDPGHGGANLGAAGPRGTLEKDVALETGLLVAQELRARGARVLLTRYADHDVRNWERIALANGVGADAFVSIHYNGCPACNAQGTETYYSRRAAGSEVLAASIHESLLARTALPDRGVRPGRWTVLNRAGVPAALVEVAFMHSPAGEELAGDPGFQQQAAAAIAEGVLRALTEG